MALLSCDGRAGEDYGLENTNGHTLLSTANLPLNIDDVDIYPSMTDLPSAKKGWTAMTFSLVNIELVKCMQRLASIANATTCSTPTSEVTRAKIIAETRATIETRLSHCNTIIPQHHLTLHCSRFLLRKPDFITRQRYELLHQRHPTSQPSAHFTSESSLVEARLTGTPHDPLISQFAWARKAYPQWHITLYILWHLCIKPEGPSVERAWRAIETPFASHDWQVLSSGFGPKKAVLATLRSKALAVRAEIQMPNTRDDPNLHGGEVEVEMRRDPSGYAIGSVPTCLLGDMSSGELGIDIDSDEWTNWEMLAQAFQPDGQAFPDGFWQ